MASDWKRNGEFEAEDSDSVLGEHFEAQSVWIADSRANQNLLARIKTQERAEAPTLAYQLNVGCRALRCVTVDHR